MPPGTGPVLLFATGAGLPSTAPWMVAWAQRLAALGPVVTFDWRYLAAGHKRPDRPEVLLETHREALARVREAHPGRRVVLVGKSMGGRIGCHLSLQEPVAGLVCFGYPLVSPSGARRDEVLRSLRTPVLFVQGTRDAMAPLPELEALRAELKARTALHVVPTGDHSLLVTRTHTRTTGCSQEDEDARILSSVRSFVDALAPEGA